MPVSAKIEHPLPCFLWPSSPACDGRQSLAQVEAPRQGYSGRTRRSVGAASLSRRSNRSARAPVRTASPVCIGRRYADRRHTRPRFVDGELDGSGRRTARRLREEHDFIGPILVGDAVGAQAPVDKRTDDDPARVARGRRATFSWMLRGAKAAATSRTVLQVRDRAGRNRHGVRLLATVKDLDQLWPIPGVVCDRLGRHDQHSSSNSGIIVCVKPQNGGELFRRQSGFGLGQW